jgi:hypothetical protein
MEARFGDRVQLGSRQVRGRRRRRTEQRRENEGNAAAMQTWMSPAIHV